MGQLEFRPVNKNFYSKNGGSLAVIFFDSILGGSLFLSLVL